ncbi:hypothetical protein [Aeromonas sp. EERV15]|uniref:hypothetical protein n=1 Tax=Aeromonas sp. EERV15 TaxID=1833892 RepID=UPI001146EB50|nr:hypothetical protein [Aeromonas sp. EERV15]
MHNSYIALTMSIIAISASSHAQERPDYCRGLLNKECALVEAANAELKEQPEYCKPGSELSKSPISLSKVQMQICEVTQGRGMPREATQHSSTPHDMSQDSDMQFARHMKEIDDANARRIEDITALAREHMIPYLNLIQSVQIGYTCGLSDANMASFAINNIHNSMGKELMESGLGVDKAIGEMNDKVEQALDDGKRMADNGACENLTPADRERLRRIINGVYY